MFFPIIIIENLPQVLIYIIALQLMMPDKKTYGAVKYISIAASILAMYIVTYIVNSLMLMQIVLGLKQLITVIMLLLVAQLICGETFLKQLIFVLGLTLCGWAAELIIDIVVLVFSGNSNSIVGQAIYTNVNQQISEAVIQLILTGSFCVCYHKNKDNNATVYWRGSVIILSMVTIAVIVILKLILSGNKVQENRNFIIWMIGGILVFNIVSILITISRFNRSTKKYEEILVGTISEEQLELAQNNKNCLEEIRAIRHEINNQYIVLEEKLQRGDVQGALDYLKGMNEQARNDVKEQVVVDTKIAAIDAAIGHFVKECKNKDITFEFDNCNLETAAENIVEYEMASVLINMMKNAVEAELAIKDNRYIKLSFGYEKNYLYMSVKNRIEEAVIGESQELTTRKIDKSHHGFGIKAIQKMVKKYEGSFEYYENPDFFVCTAYMKMHSL